MYEQYWGLNRAPFENSADAEFFFQSRTHRSALLKMQYVLENRLGAGLLVGGTGSGKTYVTNLLDHELSDTYQPMVPVLFPQLTPAELLSYLAVELGADESATGNGQAGLDRTIRQLRQQLERHAQMGRQPTLIIDEAHFIEDEHVLETLQLLLDFRQRPNVEFSLLLVGEQSLLARVGRIAGLDDRIAVKAVLQPLSKEDTDGYVQHRLAVAGTTRALFDATALEALFELSGGIPRKINRLCDLALLVGYADRLPCVTAVELEAVVDELAVAAIQ